MKILPILLMASVLAMPLCAQSRSARAAGGAAVAGEQAEARTGVRFVVCAPSGGTVPSPLYYQDGKDFRKINVSSRVPSARVRPINGVIRFWDKDPSPKEDAGDKGEKAKKLPPPYLVVEDAPGSGRHVGILVPGTGKPRTIFVNESNFPRKGVHVINFSSYPLQMAISKSGDFKDKEVSTIGVFHASEGVTDKNSWSFKGEKNGEKVSFLLSYAEPGSKELKRLKASTFVVSDRQSQITVVVKDSTRNVPKFMPIQLPADKKSGSSGGGAAPARKGR